MADHLIERDNEPGMCFLDFTSTSRIQVDETTFELHDYHVLSSSSQCVGGASSNNWIALFRHLRKTLFQILPGMARSLDDYFISLRCPLAQI